MLAGRVEGRDEMMLNVEDWDADVCDMDMLLHKGKSKNFV
jgi:hypothetical protein